MERINNYIDSVFNSQDHILEEVLSSTEENGGQYLKENWNNIFQ